MQNTQWIVITGPPSSGKTTLINALEADGYIVCREVAREIIQYSLSQLPVGQDCDRNSEALQREILAATLQREHFLDSNQFIFFDRGVPDSLAYFKFHGLTTQDAIRAAKFRRYKYIFYCEGLPVVKDSVRQESEIIAKKIGQLILESYQELNYRPIILPVCSVEERLKILMDTLGK